MTESTATAKPGPADLIEIFYAPRAVFARRRAGQFGLPYLGLVVLGVVIFLATRNLMAPVIDAEVARGVARSAAANHFTPEQTASAAAFGHKLAGVGIVGYFVIAPFLVALVLWLCGMLVKIPALGRVAVMIATFSFYPRLIGSVVGAVLAAVLPESALNSAASVSLSPARFVNPDTSPGLVALLGRFDLFILWSVVLLAIGLETAAGATRRQAWIAAVGVWVIAGLPALYQALRS